MDHDANKAKGTIGSTAIERNRRGGTQPPADRIIGSRAERIGPFTRSGSIKDRGKLRFIIRVEPQHRAE
jgi:hypothetical protein